MKGEELDSIPHFFEVYKGPFKYNAAVSGEQRLS